MWEIPNTFLTMFTNKLTLHLISCNPKVRLTIVPKKTFKSIMEGYEPAPEAVPFPRERTNAEILQNVIETYGGDKNGR